MAELAIEHLTLRFGGLTVLEDVSFAVAPGELFALIGPNGAGKTSVLNCISGVYRGSGVIRLHNRAIDGLPPHAIARLGIARTFQHGELFAHISVVDNLMEGIGLSLDLKQRRMFFADLGGSVYAASLDGADKRAVAFLQGNLTGVAYAELD